MNLKELRKERDLTSIEAAKKLGISQAYLSHLENGLRKIDVKLIRKFAKVYDISEEEIQEAAVELNARAKLSNNWVAQIRINKEPLHKAFSQELKYIPLKDNRDESELLYRLVAFVDKNIGHSVRNELTQNNDLLDLFTKV